MPKYKLQNTDIDEYFNTGNSVIDNNNSFIDLPTYDTATEEYEKITSNIGYSIGEVDISELYDIKSKFEEVSTTSSTINGGLTIPTWAKGAKVFLGTMQGAKGSDTSPAANGSPGANRGPFSPGGTGPSGNTGPAGNQGHANKCPTGQAKRERNGGPGGAGGDGGDGGDPGAAASGGAGGLGGNGATGGTGGDGVRYSSPNIINLDNIRGNGISYSVSANAVSLNSANFSYAANSGVIGNNANEPNAGQDGNDATGGQNGFQGGQGGQGGQGNGGSNSCGGSPGNTGNKGAKGTKGAKGQDATAGQNGQNGNNGNNGNKGANANVSVTGPSDLNAQTLTSNSQTSNKIIVHFFID